MRPFLLFSLACCLIYCGCRKSDTDANNVNIGIKISDCDYVDDIIYFSIQSTGSSSFSTKNLVWDFGDGAKSAEPSPTHTYTSPGTYQVTLLCDSIKLTKSLTVTPYTITSPYTAHTAGTRTWKGKANGVAEEFGTLIADSVINIDLDITVINGGMIRLPFYGTGRIMHLSSIDTTTKVLTYTSCLSGTAFLYYYYAADSMAYTNNWIQGHGYEQLTLHTP